MESGLGVDLQYLINILKSGISSQSKVKEISRQLHTSPDGLTSFPAHISLRQTKYGVNSLSSLDVDRQSFLTLLKKSLVDFEPRFIRNLAILFLLNYLFGVFMVFYSDHGDGGEESEKGNMPRFTRIFIFIVTFTLDSNCIETLLAIFVESTIRYRKQAKLEKFLERLKSAEKPSIKRDGNLVPVPLEDIVVGDICHVKPGDVVPGDGLILLDNKDLKFNSEVTSNEGVFCSAGSVVCKGTGSIMIVAVGSSTQISYLVHEPYAMKKLFDSSIILYFAIFMGLVVFFANLVPFCIKTYLFEQESWRVGHMQKFVNYLILGLTAIITSIPWFLPLVIILSLHHAENAPGPLSKATVKAVAVFNVLKFLQFILVVNIVLSTGSSLSIQFSSVQRLWIYWSTNVLAVTLYPSDAPKLEESKGAQNPEESNSKALECVKNITGQAGMQLAILYALNNIGPYLLDLDDSKYIEDPTPMQTMIFTTFTLMSYCNVFQSRKIRDERDTRERNICSRMTRHPKYWVVLTILCLLQIVIVQQGGLAFSSHPLNLTQWLYCIFCALLIPLCGQILMFIDGSRLFCCCSKNEANPTASRSAVYLDSSAAVADVPV